MSRRRGAARAVVVIWWRDIPAQVTAGAPARGSRPRKVLLDARFQHAIDRAAVVAGCTDTTSYVAQWRRTTEPLDDDPERAARLRADALEMAFPTQRLEQLVRSGGWDRATPTALDGGNGPDTAADHNHQHATDRPSDGETPTA